MNLPHSNLPRPSSQDIRQHNRYRDLWPEDVLQWLHRGNHRNRKESPPKGRGFVLAPYKGAIMMYLSSFRRKPESSRIPNPGQTWMPPIKYGAGLSSPRKPLGTGPVFVGTARHDAWLRNPTFS